MIEATREFIKEQLAAAQCPAVLVSGGKDSQTMLHLVREQMPDIAVIYFRGFPHATKHLFVESQGPLTEPMPFMRDVIGDDSGRVQMVEVFNPAFPLHFPVEAAAGFEPNASSLCGIEKLREPVSDEAWEYDCLFIGHRGDDVDPFWGEIPLHISTCTQNGVTLAYPLLEWSEADIWAATEMLGLAQNWARYSGDMTANNDYYDLCTNCLKHGQEKSYCPRANSYIENISKAAGVVEQKEFWRHAFVNMKETFYEAN